MTTVVYDGKTLASDSQITDGHIVVSRSAKKIFKLKNNDKYKAIGLAGSSSGCIKAREWFKSNSSDEYPNFDASVLAIKHDGGVDLYTDTGFDEENIPASIGSGSFLAIAAMKAGADALKAVSIAKDMDIYSGGKTNKIRF